MVGKQKQQRCEGDIVITGVLQNPTGHGPVRTHLADPAQVESFD